MNKITILQHNIDHWHFGLYNTYRHIDADIILLNHTGLTDNAPLRIQQYTVYTKNIKNDLHRGTAIAIKSHIRHRIHNDFYTDLLAVTIYSRQRPMTISLPTPPTLTPATNTSYLAESIQFTYLVIWMPNTDDFLKPPAIILWAMLLLIWMKSGKYSNT